MQDHRLKAFCLLAELRSFSKAARVKHLTQSAMSHIIRNLEEELGVKLVNRHKKNITLTPAGRVFYSHAKKILSQYKLLVEDVSRVSGKEGGNLNIGATQAISGYILPRILYEFKNKFPDVKLNLMVMDTTEIITLLEQRSIDIGLIESRNERSILISESFLKDRVVVVASDMNPLSKKVVATKDDLVSQSFILPEKGSDLRKNIEMILKKEGIDIEKLKTAMVVNDIELIVKMVMSGMGVGFIYRSVVEQLLREGVLIEVPLRGINLNVDFYTIYHKEDKGDSKQRYLIRLLKEQNRVD